MSMQREKYAGVCFCFLVAMNVVHYSYGLFFRNNEILFVGIGKFG